MVLDQEKGDCGGQESVPVRGSCIQKELTVLVITGRTGRPRHSPGRTVLGSQTWKGLRAAGAGRLLASLEGPCGGSSFAGKVWRSSRIPASWREPRFLVKAPGLSPCVACRVEKTARARSAGDVLLNRLFSDSVCGESCVLVQKPLGQWSQDCCLSGGGEKGF